MGLLVLCRVFSDLAFSVIDREKVASLEELVVDLAQPLRGLGVVKGDNAVVVRAAIPRLHKVRFHALGPFFQRYIPHQCGDGHTCPHRPAVDVGLTAVVSFTPGKDHLERQAPVGHRGDCNSKRVDVLPVVALMAVGELFAYPALKIRDVACKIHLAPS